MNIGKYTVGISECKSLRVSINVKINLLLSVICSVSTLFVCVRTQSLCAREIVISLKVWWWASGSSVISEEPVRQMSHRSKELLYRLKVSWNVNMWCDVQVLRQQRELCGALSRETVRYNCASEDQQHLTQSQDSKTLFLSRMDVLRVLFTISLWLYKGRVETFIKMWGVQGRGNETHRNNAGRSMWFAAVFVKILRSSGGEYDHSLPSRVIPCNKVGMRCFRCFFRFL